MIRCSRVHPAADLSESWPRCEAEATRLVVLCDEAWAITQRSFLCDEHAGEDAHFAASAVGFSVAILPIPAGAVGFCSAHDHRTMIEPCGLVLVDVQRTYVHVSDVGTTVGVSHAPLLDDRRPVS